MSDATADFILTVKRRMQPKLPLALGMPRSEYAEAESALQQLYKASNYSLQSGGKYIRSALLYYAAEAVSPEFSPEVIDHAACAIEMIHTYSLVHDDLPSMDDDDLRRGKPSCHKAFDEATAILVGDGLQANAFELLTTAQGLSTNQRIAMLQVLTAASGPRGMVGGQYIDISAAGTDMTLQQLKTMHSLKTGALIRAALAMGGIAAGATERQLAALDAYGSHIGLGFQVVDDVLDVEGDSVTLGKTQGKDDESNKPTYVSLLGLDGARKEAQRLLQASLDALQDFGESADHLRDLARYIVERDH